MALTGEVTLDPALAVAPAYMGDAETRWRACQHCGETFGQPRRKRGRAVVFCGDDCRKAYGRNGEIRLDDAAKGTGYVALEWGERHGGPMVEPNAEALADLFGLYDDVRAGVVVYDGVDLFTRELDRNLFDERKRALRAGVDAVSDLYDLGGAADVGETNTGARAALVGPVVGQPDLTADWQERLDASRSWVCA